MESPEKNLSAPGEAGKEVPEQNPEQEPLKESDNGSKTYETTEEKNPRETIDSRFHQSYGSRLAEYLTGLQPENPKLVDRLFADQETVRVKYGLPDKEMRFDSPSEYEHFLRDSAKKLGIDIREKSDCGSFFSDYPNVGGAHFNEGWIGASMEKEDSASYKRSLATLEHEMIHAFQREKYPAMPIERMEYEAYISNANLDHLRDNPNPESVEAFFSHLVGGSVSHWYSSESERRGQDINPDWENPEFFLRRVDEVPDSEVKSYKESDEYKQLTAEGKIRDLEKIEVKDINDPELREIDEKSEELQQ